ncbi:MAG: hypothetical protein EBT07_11100 [Actinobacteria bacterium]|nr:hypothetical protein [Actinomycetota bacterium]
MNIIFPLFLFCVATRCFAGSLDLIEFESQGNAPIYVIEGDIIYNNTINGVAVSLNCGGGRLYNQWKRQLFSH